MNKGRAYAAFAVMGLGCMGSLMSGEPQLALAQNASRDGQEVPRFAPGAIQHSKEMRRFRDPDRLDFLFIDHIAPSCHPAPARWR
jgi:hypothetical protein